MEKEENRPEILNRYLPEDVCKRYIDENKSRVKQYLQHYTSNTDTFYILLIGPSADPSKRKSTCIDTRDIDIAPLFSTNKEELEQIAWRRYTDKLYRIVELKKDF